ncbi:AaceriACL071Cp [[Ashbya] aceris (nom. inval.)]|nr:AaceriACL071Cp [[Ashbya] aceris (nom. inval.)]
MASKTATAEQTGAAAVKPDVDPDTTIFIGNLAGDCSEEDLKQVFGAHVEVEIPSNKTGKFYKQRYAFVKFPAKIDFEEVKEKYDKTVVRERSIYVRQALTKEQRDQHKQLQRGSRLAARGARRGKKFVRGQAVPAPPQREKVPLDQLERSSDTLYVNNIPYYATKEEIAEFFGTKPELIVLPMRRMRDTVSNRFFYSKSMNRGIAFVTFEDVAGDAIVQKMEQFQGKVLKDREITVDVAATKPESYDNDHDHEPETSPDHEHAHGAPPAAPAPAQVSIVPAQAEVA